MTNARDKANIPVLNFQSKGIDDNATSTAITIDSGQNVGINGSPNSYSGYGNLTLGGTSGGIFDLDVNGTRTGSFLALSSEVRVSTITNVPLNFQINNAEKMRLTSTGLGIGTSSPSTILHVQQSAVSNAPSRTSALYLENNANCEIQFVGNSSNDCQIRFGTSSNSFKGAIEYELDNNNFEFYTNGSEVMRIDSSGNVGIGTSSPTAKLNVNGAIVGGQKGDSSPDNTDVSGVNSLTVSTGAGSRTINGLVGGVTGQVLHIIKTNSAFTLTIADQNATSPGDEIKTADGNNISLTIFGGVTLLFYNGAWWEVGR